MNTECAICFAEITFLDKKWTCRQCKFVIHKNCFIKWSKNCPMCRHEDTVLYCLKIKKDVFNVLISVFLAIIVLSYYPLFVYKTCDTEYIKEYIIWYIRKDVCFTRFELWSQMFY